jgi:hypothetical protein
MKWRASARRRGAIVTATWLPTRTVGDVFRVGAGFADFFMARFPRMVMAQAMLGDRFGGFRARIVDIWRNANESKDGRLLVPQQYLLSIVRM